MDHPPYNHNLTPSYFCLFGPLKKYLDEKKFSTDAEVKQTVTSLLQKLDIDFFYPRNKPWIRDGIHA
jgi:hypothetical protein